MNDIDKLSEVLDMLFILILWIQLLTVTFFGILVVTVVTSIVEYILRKKNYEKDNKANRKD